MIRAWRVARPTAIPERPDPEGLLEPGVDALPVRVTIHQNGVLTGWDDGALGFEDDAVWFSGRACSFHLANQDVLSDLPALLVFRRDLPEFRLRHPSRRVVVRLCPVEMPGRNAEEDAARVRRALALLLRADPAGFVSEYPPLSPRPGMVSPVLSWLTLPRRLALATAFLVLALLAGHPFLIAACALGALFALTGDRVGDRDQPALRRIAREESGPPSSFSCGSSLPLSTIGRRGENEEGVRGWRE